MRGTYVIVASLTNRPDCGTVRRSFTAIDPKPTSFIFRVFPPAGLAAPIQEFRLTGEQASDDLKLTTDSRKVSVQPYDDTAKELPSYVQVTSPGSSLVLEGN